MTDSDDLLLLVPIAVFWVVFVPVLVLLVLQGPPHTLESVARELIEGLRNGTIVLEESE